MSTSTRRAPKSKTRSCRLLVAPNAKGQNAVLRITVDGTNSDYILDRVHAAWGKGFALTKTFSCTAYHVNLDGRESTCDCPAGTFKGRCKHLDSLTALVAAGKL